MVLQSHRHDHIDIQSHRYLFVYCLLNGTSALFKLLVPRIVKIKQMKIYQNRFVTDKLLKNDLRQVEHIGTM